MMNIEKLLKSRRLTLALLGIAPEEFLSLVPAFAQCAFVTRERRYRKNSHRKRKPGGGAKRLRIITDIFRNRIKNSHDQAMLIACGLWNYHLAQSC